MHQPRFFKSTDDAVHKTLARLEEQLTQLQNAEYLKWMRSESRDEIQDAISLLHAQLETLKKVLHADQQIEAGRLRDFEKMSINVVRHFFNIQRG